MSELERVTRDNEALEILRMISESCGETLNFKIILDVVDRRISDRKFASESTRILYGMGAKS